MADIVLNVEVRENPGTGGARLARRDGRIPGVLYGGPLGPVSISAPRNEFRKVLYSGKFLGHLVTLKHGGESQPVIAKDVQFHPVSDEPLHFDLYRVDAHQQIRIAVPVHFKNEDVSPGMKRGGALNIALHEVQLMAPADSIPEELVIDLATMDIGDSVRTSDLILPKGVEIALHDRDATVASIGASSAMQSEEAEGGEGDAAAAES
jgi:large subunit ribosomal protein L25